MTYCTFEKKLHKLI